MARRRGLTNDERLAVDILNATATGTILSAPAFLYKVAFTLSDSTTSGKGSLGDSSASGDVAADTTRLDFKAGTAGASGNSVQQQSVSFNPPIYISKGLCWNVSTGIASVSVTYLAAS